MSQASLTDATYKKLLAYVLGAQPRPDGKLKIAELAQSMSVSPSVVREGLSRLVADGLVVAEPQKGFRVAPLDRADGHYLFEARIQIECLCLMDAIKHADLAWEGRLVAALHELAKTPEERGQRGDVSVAWLNAHSKFHSVLVSACQNPWYLKIRANLFQHSERYRALVLQHPVTERDLRAEHEQLARAAIDRDAETARALITLHLKRTINEFEWKNKQENVA